LKRKKGECGHYLCVLDFRKIVESTNVCPCCRLVGFSTMQEACNLGSIEKLEEEHALSTAMQTCHEWRWTRVHQK
jgi:hypothetical protein